jgi:hypothetical protein
LIHKRQLGWHVLCSITRAAGNARGKVESEAVSPGHAVRADRIANNFPGVRFLNAARDFPRPRRFFILK